MTVFAVGLLVAGLLTPLVMAVAPRLKLVDVPNERSSHRSSVPRAGGIAVTIATVAAVAVGDQWSGVLIAMVIGATVLAITGLVDDRLGLPPLPRLAVQVATPLAIVPWVVDRVGAGAVVAVALAVVVVVGFVNAFNFMDGINGISALQAIVAGLFLAALGDHLDRREVVVASLAMAGAAAGFMPFNIARGRIFLGDVGSYFLGAWMAALGALALDSGAPAMVVAAPYLLYVADTSTVLIRRASRGEPVMSPHREHAYQRLVQLGLGHVPVAVLCAAISATCSALMYAVVDRSGAVQLLVFLVCTALVAAYVALPQIVILQRRRETGPGRV